MKKLTANMSGEALARAVKLAAAVAPRNPARPILGNVRIVGGESSLALLATDLDLSVRVEVPGAHVDGDADILVSAARLQKIAAASKGEERIIIEVVEDKLKLTVGGVTHELPGSIDTAAFPHVSRLPEGEPFAFGKESLAAALRRTLFAVASKGTRYAINGIFFEGQGRRTKFVATDGKRLSEVKVRNLRGPRKRYRGILPPRLLRAVVHRDASDDKDADVSLLLRFDKKKKDSHPPGIAFARVGDVTYSALLVEGRYPAYEGIIPNLRKKKEKGDDVTVDRRDFEKRLKQLDVISTADHCIARFAIAPGSMTLSQEIPDGGKSTSKLAVEFKGEARTVEFNIGYLLDLLTALNDEEKFTFNIGVPTRAMLVQREGFRHVLMPVRIR